MRLSTSRRQLQDAVVRRPLLTHPYYLRWQEGLLSPSELAEYASQYRHVERALPEVLQAVAASISHGQARASVEDTLRDELSNPMPHAVLFEQFAEAVGAGGSSPAPATAALIDLYRRAAAAGPVPALAVIGAYEVQAAEVAATKAESLRAYYQVGSDGTAFWDTHAELEEDHGAWAASALDALDPDQAEVQRFAAMSADAWWTFLDERDAVIS